MIKLLLMGMLSLAEVHIDFVKNYVIITKPDEVKIIQIKEEDILNGKVDKIVEQVKKEMKR